LRRSVDLIEKSGIIGSIPMEFKKRGKERKKEEKERVS
jgi:hypothetical protein